MAGISHQAKYSDILYLISSSDTIDQLPEIEDAVVQPNPTYNYNNYYLAPIIK